MRNLVETIFSILLALILALFVWVAAVQEQDPIVERLLQDPIAVEVKNKPEGLDIVNPSQVTEFVQLVVRAPESSWNSLSAASFQAWVDLAGLKTGQQDVLIQVSCTDSAVRIEEVQPPRMSLRLEPVSERVLQVEIRILDEAALGYQTASPTADPPTVRVIGPSSRVSLVESVTADVYVHQSKDMVEREVAVIARDADGNPVSQLTSIEPSSVNVTVPIEQEEGYRDVAVRVVRKGEVATDYRLTGIEVDPAIVTVRGSREALEGLPGYVETLPVEIGGATSDVHAEIGLVLPEGISIQGDQKVSVTVRVEPIIGSITIQRQVSIQGLRDVYTATLSPDTVDVIISGPLAILDALSLEDVRVVVDLFELGQGTHKVAPQVFAPEGLTAEAILPETVEVKIEVKPGFTVPTATPTRRPTATPTATPTPTPRP